MLDKQFNLNYKKYEKMIHHLLHQHQIKYHYDDYFQLMVIKLWDLLKSYDESKSTNQEKYIYLKLKYYLIDCLRKNIKEINRFLPTSDYTLLDQSYSDFYQYELYSLLEILNEEELTWLNLTLQGFSTNEIIIYMNKSPSSIKRYRTSTREKLKSELLF